MNDKRIDWALLLLRLTFGGMMLFGHGWSKLLKLFGDDPIKFADPFGTGPEIALGLAVLAEVVCCALLVLGLFTRWAAIPLVVTMLVAVFIIHGGDPLADREMAILYLIPYVALLLAGPGAYSLDAWRANRQF